MCYTCKNSGERVLQSTGIVCCAAQCISVTLIHQSHQADHPKHQVLQKLQIIMKLQLTGEAAKQGGGLKANGQCISPEYAHDATRLCSTQERLNATANQGHADTAHLIQEAKRQQADPKADYRSLILVPVHPCAS